MILPAVFPALNTAAIKAIVGSSPIRIYRHGQAPEGTVRPYITWFVVSGNPVDQVSGTPCADMDTVQIDCWSEADAQVETLADAVRSALDSAGVYNRVRVNNFEPDTKLYRIGIEADFITPRS